MRFVLFHAVNMGFIRALDVSDSLLSLSDGARGALGRLPAAVLNSDVVYQWLVVNGIHDFDLWRMSW